MFSKDLMSIYGQNSIFLQGGAPGNTGGNLLGAAYAMTSFYGGQSLGLAPPRHAHYRGDALSGHNTDHQGGRSNLLAPGAGQEDGRSPRTFSSLQAGNWRSRNPFQQ